MKIAILSMQKIINYGSVLQAYSLQQIVEDITGTKVDFIDIEENDLVNVNMPIKDGDEELSGNGCLQKENYLRKKWSIL